jgi:alkylation response protein AidB-like acyl-CoA dehydrogenase
MTSSATVAENGLYGLDLESRQMVIETVRQLRNKLLTKELVLAFDKDEVFPEETIRQMLGPEIGLQLIFIPEAYGGMGGGARDCCDVTREMARICLGVGTAFFAIQLGADPIIVGGTREQKEKWLGTIAEGNVLVAYAVTEPGAGSNLAALTTKADPVLDDAGQVSGYRINGTKQFISTGGYADFVTVLAKTPEGPSFFIVEKGTPGFEQGKGEEKHGIRASNTSPLSFSDVLVPQQNLVGGIPGKGLKQANKVFGYTRLMVASMALGAAEEALDIAIGYAKERIQFNAPLSDKQGYTHKLIVPHAVNLAAAAAYVEEMCVEVDRDVEKDVQVEGSIAKLFTTEAANDAADHAIQALGGYGYISEFEVEKIKRDIRITSIYEGTSEIQQNIISTYRWKITRKTKGAFYDTIRAEMQDLAASFENGGCELLSQSAHLLNDLINQAHDHRLTRQQYIMFALADLMALVEIGASLAKKASSLAAKGHPQATKYRAMSRIFAHEVAQKTTATIPMVLMGTGVLSQDELTAYLQESGAATMVNGYAHIITEMDTVADILFERKS